MAETDTTSTRVTTNQAAEAATGEADTGKRQEKMLTQAMLLAQAIGNTAMVFQGATVFYHIANEGLSILENADQLGVRTPRFIHDRLEVMRDENNKSPDDEAGNDE